MGDKLLTVLITFVGVIWFMISVLIFLAPVVLLFAMSYWLIEHA